MAIDLELSSSQCLAVGVSAALNGKGGATIMAWINVESVGASGTPGIFNMAIGPPPGTSTNTRLGLAIRNADSKLHVQTRAADADALVTNTSTGLAISNGVWTHVAAIADIPGDATRIYINGVQDASFTRTFTPTTYSATDCKNASIGSEDDGSTNFFDGQVADVRLYDRVLSVTEILNIVLARGADGNFHGCMHRWALNELSPGTTATAPRDSAVRAITLTPAGSPVYSAHPIRTRRQYY